MHGGRHRSGPGRGLPGLIEERLSGRGRDGVRVAVLDENPGAPVFRRTVGRRVIDHREDRQTGRPCPVLHRDLPPGATRTIGG